MNEVTIPLKLTGIAAIKAELRETKDLLASATDPAEIERFTARASELDKKLKGVNNSIKAFGEGNKFEAISNGFDKMQYSLSNLDFAGVGSAAQKTALSISSINPEEITKGLGKMAGGIKNLSAAFIKMGVSLLANPIFLIVAAVVAIIAVVALVLKSFGFLDVVLDALMAPVRAVIQGFKDLTDWLGLTAYAAEDQAARSKAAMEKGEQAINRSTNVKTEALDRQIMIDKASGKSTLLLEINKANIIIAAARKNYALKLQAYKDELALGKNADKKVLQELRDKMAAERKIIMDQGAFKKVALINEGKDTKSHSPREQKIREPKATKEPRQKNTELEAVQKAQEEAAEYILTLTMTASEKELYEVNKKYTALIASAKKFKQDTKDLEIAQMNAQNEIALKDAAAQKEKAAAKAIEVAKEIEIEDARYNELQRLTAANEQDKIKQVQLFVEYERLIAQQAYDEKIKDLKEGDALLIAETTALQLQLQDITAESKKKELAITKEAEDKKRAEIKKTAETAKYIA